MSEIKTVGRLAIVLALLGLLGCARQNFRTITKIDSDASVKGDLPWQPQDGRVITLWIDKTNTTMSTLYGNEVAVDFARSSGGTAYPAGAAIALVTWRQKEDERWFGASTPETVQSAEFVTVTTTSAQNPHYLYQRFGGSPLRQSDAEEMSIPKGRVEFLLSQPAASMP